MSDAGPDTFDVVIIGAGIGGLVCGCYLAKAGLKVLIAEQHDKPGGYCTSFRRGEFLFDAAAHSFGSYRAGGIMRTILGELGVDTRISIKRFNPSDQVIFPGGTISFWADLKETIRELRQVFPRESRLEDFFSFISHPKPAEMAALRSKTFKDLLDQYFVNEGLKSVLSYQVFVNGGLPPSLMSAFSGAKLFTEIVIDGGYYPSDGMQSLSDAIADRFVELGGKLILHRRVVKICVEQQEARGVVLESGKEVLSRYVISNCDASQTFLRLLGKEHSEPQFIEKIASMVPSLSMFIAYLGVDNDSISLPQPGTTLWYLPHQDLDQMYFSARREQLVDLTKYLCKMSPQGNCLVAMTNAPFKNETFWREEKDNLLEAFIDSIEETSIPKLSKHIRYKETATPITLNKYTLNDQGAAYGWECSVTQSMIPDFRRPSFIRGLYLTGHWTTYGQGLGGVAYLGYDLAKFMVHKEGLA